MQYRATLYRMFGKSLAIFGGSDLRLKKKEKKTYKHKSGNKLFKNKELKLLLCS